MSNCAELFTSVLPGTPARRTLVFVFRELPWRQAKGPLLLAGFACGALQVAAFSDLLIKKLPYSRRMLVFILPFFILLTASAILFDWFPVEYAGAWVLFVGIFFGIFLLLAAAFAWYYHLTRQEV